MERVGTLINKLKEQFDQQADVVRLAQTAQLLLAELQQRKEETVTVTTRKVAVVMPQVAATVSASVETITVRDSEPVGAQWLLETQEEELPTLAHQEAIAIKEPVKEPVKETYVLRELNHALAVEAESLNERLKEERVEIMSALQDTPVRDLKKAIGINDRYLFVNDLFRGDESMYERSIKTINSFSIYPEAQYWIQRELKVKLSWPDNSETVRLFDQLIRRRFA